MRSPYSVLVAVAWFGLITLPRVAVAEDPSVDELITLAPTVSSAGGKYRDIYLTGRAKLEGFLEVGFRAQYHAPDRYSLCITMPHDNTPFIYQINKELVIYDPVDGAMIYLSNACFNYKLHVVNGKFRFSFGVWKSDDPCAILVDVRSFYDHKATKSEVVRVDSRSLRFTQSRASGISVVGIIDRSRQCCFKQFHLEGGTEGLCLRINELAVDEDAARTWLVFPSKDRFVGRAVVKDFSDDALYGKSATSAAIRRSYVALLAIQNKALREDYETQFGVRPDWSKVEASDRRISSAIREVIRLPPEPDTKRTQ